MELSIGTVLLLILAVIITMLYNMVIRARLKMDESGSTIDILLNKRFDLITNLVEVVKGYTKYEEDVLSKVVELRNTCHVKPNKNKYNEGLNEAETKLLAVVEGYPDLKADALYLELMKQLSDVEEQLQAARRFYNANVTNYN
ncbi:LemA protein, partial [Dielma fastidiosa]